MPRSSRKAGVPASDGGVEQGPRRRRRPEPTPVARAIGLLSRREHSAQELRGKLLARGVLPEQADAALARIQEAGWQDDARFAEMLVRSRAGQGYGPVRIRAELAVHGLPETLIEEAMAAAQADWEALVSRQLRRRYGAGLADDLAMQRKAADFLWRRGFELDHLRAACRLLADADD